MLKLFSDHYILSQKTKILYISAYSSFGILAGSFALHDQIYSVGNLKKISKTEIINESSLVRGGFKKNSDF